MGYVACCVFVELDSINGIIDGCIHFYGQNADTPILLHINSEYIVEKGTNTINPFFTKVLQTFVSIVVC
ncbi:hypothetical protein JGUZn3_14120 [Entomobacter blattae]|uniref:Uncharacterized protein n=1 Tax=Entomobacter blattae TaxID=2762277 RepID=A0A7H1NS77_9PROT|nr:hypothetical protein JGUZn3_14120 [Entomobacter blattae]